MSMIPGSKFQALSGSERPHSAQTAMLGPVDEGERVSVTLLLRHRLGSPPLPDLNHWQNTPPAKRNFPSVEEFTRTWGASDEDLEAVSEFLRAQDLSVRERHSGRLRVVAEGTATQINAAFGIRLNRYQAPLRHRSRGATIKDGRRRPKPAETTQIHHGFEGPVHLPSTLMGVVTAVIGLDNRRYSAPLGSGDPPNAVSLLPTDLALNYYNFPPLTAENETIGLFADAKDGACFLPADISDFVTKYPTGAIPMPNVTAIGLTVGTATYANDNGAILAGTANDNAWEITQDICTSGAIAQGANINVYLTENTENGWEAFLNRALVPDPLDNAPSVLSASWNFSPAEDPSSIGEASMTGSPSYVISSLLQRASTRGITVFVAIGDWGSDNDLLDGLCHLSYPACDPWVTSCGGTMIGNASPTAPHSFEEVVWSDAFSPTSPFGDTNDDWGATGGGAPFNNFGLPPYQEAAGLSPTCLNTGKVGRGAPDVAGMVALTGFYFGGGEPNPFTGTSCVAPLYAGLAAVLNAALGQKIGFLNPTLYSLGGTPAFKDVTSGNNDSGDTPLAVFNRPPAPYYTAALGWDACSGLGSINGTNLLAALQPPSVYISGGYQSPDIILTDPDTGTPVQLGGQPGGPWDTLLVPGAPYDLSAVIHNDSETEASNVQVSFWAIPGGVGISGTSLGPPKIVSVPPNGSVPVSSPGQFIGPDTGQHMCAAVSIYSPATRCAIDATLAQEIPDPGASGEPKCSAWRNTDSIFGIAGLGFGFKVGLGELPFHLAEPIKLGINPVHVSSKWLQAAKADEIAVSPKLASARPRIPPYLLPSAFRTLPAIDLKPRVKALGRGKMAPKGAGSWDFSPAAGESSHAFELTGKIPKTAKKGDIVLVKVTASYPRAGEWAARTVEFLEVIHIRNE